jgi:hypothetical protein
MERRTHVDTARLFDAADMLLRALESDEGLNTLIPVRRETPNGSGAVPIGVFTQAELVEAMDMLIRLGLVGTPQHLG